MRSKLDSTYILKLFDKLNEELAKKNIKGELYLVGGAVMCLQFHARPSTYDIDAIFAPKKELMDAIKIVADEHGLDENWINDAAKGFLGKNSKFNDFIDMSNLKIFCASPEYLLAMKCLSMRLGEEFKDEDDIRFLLRYLNLKNAEQVIELVAMFYDRKLIPQKTFYALQEMLAP